MMRNVALILGIALLLLPVVIAGEGHSHSEEYTDLSDQLGKVFSFMGLENPYVEVSEEHVDVYLTLPRSYAEEGTLSYVIINSAEIAPHTKEIIVHIRSGEDAAVEARASTHEVLQFVDGELTQEEFQEKIHIKRVQSTIDIVFGIIALIIIVIVFHKIYQYIHVNQEKQHIHKHHPVHSYVKSAKKPAKKTAKRKATKKSKKHK